MPGTVYENQSFGPNMTFQEGDIFVGCSFSYGTRFMEGSVFDGCTLAGNSCYNCDPYIYTGLGNVFGNKTAPCSFYYVIFGPENVLHENWINSGSNTMGTPGNYGLPGVYKIEKGVVVTNVPCQRDSGEDLPDGVKLERLCLTYTHKTTDGDTVTGDRTMPAGGGGGGGGAP